MCCYFCVCVSCSEATAFPYFGTTICWPKLKSHTQTLHHGLRNSFFSITWMPWRLIPPGTQNIPPDHPTHYGSPPLCRSCHGPRFCRRHALAQKSVCLLVSVFPDWFWDNMIPPGTRNDSTIQDRIYFGPLYVRYLWPLVRPQYPPSGSRLILHNPLGLSRGLKSSSTSPQKRGKAAAIAIQKEA